MRDVFSLCGSHGRNPGVLWLLCLLCAAGVPQGELASLRGPNDFVKAVYLCLLVAIFRVLLGFCKVGFSQFIHFAFVELAQLLLGRRDR